MKDKKCLECKGKMIEKFGEYEPGFTYRYWKCIRCGEELLDMGQLRDAAARWKKFTKTPKTTISKWGNALAVRIPKEIVERQRIRQGERFLILPDKKGFRAVPERK